MPFARKFLKTPRRIGLLCIALFSHSSVHAADTPVAVAANFAEPAKEIATAFRRATGHTATLIFGASGSLYAQISHGAPFEVLLSADAERPVKAEQEGFAVSGSRFTYAIGRLALYSADPLRVDRQGAVLKRGQFAKIAIADPAVAPYGIAAVQVMHRLGVYSALTPKLVLGSSLTQAFQFTSSGAAELGFVGYSQIKSVTGGSRWIVPARLHQPIEQQAILLKTGAGNPAASAFMRFLRSGTAQTIIKRYGYDIR